MVLHPQLVDSRELKLRWVAVKGSMHVVMTSVSSGTEDIKIRKSDILYSYLLNKAVSNG